MSGEPVNTGVMMASTDAITMDLSVCKMLGIEPMGIPTLKRAKLRGQWPQQIDYPILSPNQTSFKGFKLPSTASYPLTDKKRPKRSPQPGDKCNRCGDCVRICPRKAITLNNIAKVDYSLCIRCFCCHEVCPEKAIDLVVLK
jgi:Pyruvate/2-oxoacid:ferredoxin oxidoreductase delta subunit